MAGTVLQVARARMGEILWREAPVDADVVIPVPDSGNAAARGLARAVRPAPGRRLHQEPLRRAHLHPARPGAAPARPAAEVQPAARGGGGQAPGRRRRLDRARQHDPPDRADAARRRRRRDPPADLRAADQASLPLRDRHVHARGDDRPRAHRRARSRAEIGADSLHYSVARGRLRGGRRVATEHCDACFSGDYPLAGTEDSGGKFALENSPLPLVRA